MLKFLCLLFSVIAVTSIEAKLPTYPFGDYPSKYWQFWWLYETESRPGQNETIIRPFYSSYHENLSDTYFYTSLYPIFYKQKTNYWEKWTFLFIFNKDSTIHPDTGEDTDFNITPLLNWGSGETSRDRYYGIFPFYGQIRSKLSWAEINFVMFPIYSNWQNKEFKAHSILWPMIIWGSSDNRKEYRFIPFFSYKSHPGKFYHSSVLWPFVQWGVDNLDKKEPSSYSFIFPFYNIKKSMHGNMGSYSYFWLPLLGGVFGYGYDKRTSEVDFNVLFFFIQYGYSNSKDYRKHIFFPFYGYSRFASKEFTFITPFYLHMRSDTYGVRSEYYYSIPLFYYITKHFVKENRTDIYFKFWPLFKYHKDSIEKFP